MDEYYNGYLPEIKVLARMPLQWRDNIEMKKQEGESENNYIERMTRLSQRRNQAIKNVNQAQHLAAKQIFDVAKQPAYFVPVVGNAVLAGDVAGQVLNKDYTGAATTLGTIGALKYGTPYLIKGTLKAIQSAKNAFDRGIHVGNYYTNIPKNQNYAYRMPRPAKPAYKITAENAANITPAQWTAAQDAAIARGDMAEVQRLRDLHFKVNAPNTKIVNAEGMPQHVYHGTTSKPFTVFNINAPRKHDLGTYGKGFYFTPNKNTAINYGEGKTLFDSYLNLKTPYSGSEDVVDNIGNFKNLKELKNYYKRQGFSEYELNNINWGNFDFADGVNAGNEIMVLKPNQIKLADAVTYDNNGVRIPLGKRDNFNMNDIRYAIFPFVGGYGLYNAYIKSPGFK